MKTDPGHPWLSDYQQAVNADYSSRVVVLPSASAWQATGFDGLQIRIFEYIPGDAFRLTAQLRAVTATQRSSLQQHAGMEALVQSGELSDQNNVYPAGLYLRDPASSLRPHSGQPLHFGTAIDDTFDISAGLLFLSLGQFEKSDTEERRINTNDESKWLPGPEEGTEVMPLHVHGTSNAMLVRWVSTATFVPRLDPCGEEILVLNGTLNDECGRYPTGSWIRNPVEAWQSWSADAGTVIYYKNGHFPKALSCS
jgi:anti-sigma factor ChrR (cupin superfamily)